MGIEDVLKTLSVDGYSESLPEIAEDEFFKALHSRRSVRIYTAEKIPESVVRKCLKAALSAPNSSNMQPWEIHWVRSPEKRKELVANCLGQPAAATAAELFVFVGRTNTWKQMRELMLEHFKTQTNIPKSAIHYYTKIIPLAFSQGPLGLFGLAKKIGIFFMGLQKPTPRGPASAHDMELWATKTVALACENFMLSMRACGFDSCPMEGFDAVRVAKMLNLPADASVTMVISAGKRAANGVYGPQVRFDETLFVKEH